MNDTTFIEAARTVTAPGYQPLPFDEDVVLFQVHGEALLELRESVTADEFTLFCRDNEWIGGTADEITPFLDAMKQWEEEA